MKNFLCAFYLFAQIGLLFSQQTTLSFGGDANQRNGSISYSVGQINGQSQTGIESSVSKGGQQPYEISVIEIVDTETMQMYFSIFPNLTTHILNLKI